jgi:hypothetical protein
VSQNQRAGLLVLLSVDGSGVLVLTLAAAAGLRGSILSTAVVAAAGWVLALAGVVGAVRSPRTEAVLIARRRVAAGIAVNAVGSAYVLVSYPSATLLASVVLIAGTALGVGYLLLLRRSQFS